MQSFHVAFVGVLTEAADLVEHRGPLSLASRLDLGVDVVVQSIEGLRCADELLLVGTFEERRHEVRLHERRNHECACQVAGDLVGQPFPARPLPVQP